MAKEKEHEDRCRQWPKGASSRTRASLRPRNTTACKPRHPGRERPSVFMSDVSVFAKRHSLRAVKRNALAEFADRVAGFSSRWGALIAFLRFTFESGSCKISFPPGVNAGNYQIINRTEMPAGNFLRTRRSVSNLISIFIAA